MILMSSNNYIEVHIIQHEEHIKRHTQAQFLSEKLLLHKYNDKNKHMMQYMTQYFFNNQDKTVLQ